MLTNTSLKHKAVQEEISLHFIQENSTDIDDIDFHVALIDQRA